MGSYDRGERGYDRGGDRGYDRGGDRGYDRDRGGKGFGGGRGGYDRDREYDRGPEKGGKGGKGSSYGKGKGDGYRREEGGFGRDGGGFGRDGGGFSSGRPPSSTGRIAVLKEGFGFIDCADEVGAQGGSLPRVQHYFSFNAILGRDKVPRLGDEVRYAVEPDRRSGREAATRIEILAPGTLPPPPRPPEVELQGVIESVGRNGGRVVSRPADDEAASADTTPPITYTFAPNELPRDGPPIAEGDIVSFTTLAEAPPRGQRRTARKIVLIKQGNRFQGLVSSVKEHFGFIRQADAAGDLFFHFSELPRDAQADVRPGVEVEFSKSKDQRSGKEAATRVAVLPPGSVCFEVVLERTRYEGVIATSSSIAASLAPNALRPEKLSHGGVVRALVPEKEKGEGGGGGKGGGGKGGAGRLLSKALGTSKEAGAAEAESAANGDDAAGEEEPPKDSMAALPVISSSWADEVEEEEEAPAREKAAAEKAASEAEAAAKVAAEEAAERSLLAKLSGSSGAPPRPHEKFGFGMGDLDEEVIEAGGLFEGDKVSFCLAVERNGGARGAARLRLIEARWERGFIAHVKQGDGYGFIRPAKSVGGGSAPQIYFSFSSMADEKAKPRANDEVEYRVASAASSNIESRGRHSHDSRDSASRSSAALIRQLPRGTIVTEWLLPEWWLAKVAKVPRKPRAGGKGGGAEGGMPGSLTFTRLMTPDDEPVEQTPAAPAAAPAAAEPAAEGEAAAAEAEAAPAEAAAAGGAKSGTKRAPPNSLSPGQALWGASSTEGGGGEDAAKGPATGATPSARARTTLEALRSTATDSAAPAETDAAPVAVLPALLVDGVAFGMDDLLSGRTNLGVGDLIACQMVVGDEVGRARPSRIRLVAAAVEERERGVVHAIKDTFGFLKCESREGQIFFHLNAIVGSGSSMTRVGDEFDFVINQDDRNGRQNAIKLKPLPRGSVKFETVLKEGLTGTVVSLNVASGNGELIADEPWEGESGMRVPFTRHGVVVPKGGMPAVGSSVTYTLGKHKAKGHMVAIDVSGAVRAAVVERLINSSKGILRLVEPLAPPPTLADAPADAPAAAAPSDEPAADATPSAEAAPAAAEPEAPAPASEAPAPASEAPAAEDAPAAVSVLGVAPGTISTVVFYAADVAEKDVTLSTGDEVEMVLAANTKTGEVSGKQIRRTKEGPKAPERAMWVRKELTARTNIIRYSKGPDGTRGFAAGRGRPIVASDADASGLGDAI